MQHIDPASDPKREISLGRAMLVGGLLGYAVVWATITSLALGHDVRLTEAMAFGAFVGFWGGVGLGSMVAATIPLARLLPRPVAVSESGARSKPGVG